MLYRRSVAVVRGFGGRTTVLCGALFLLRVFLERYRPECVFGLSKFAPVILFL